MTGKMEHGVNMGGWRSFGVLNLTSIVRLTKFFGTGAGEACLGWLLQGIRTNLLVLVSLLNADEERFAVQFSWTILALEVL